MRMMERFTQHRAVCFIRIRMPASGVSVDHVGSILHSRMLQIPDECNRSLGKLPVGE